MDFISLQERCDSLEYPPTHTYDVRTLKPSGVLSERIKTINSVAPELLQGKRFLDVGCNKGWFSLKASESCESVVGFDPSVSAIALCSDMARPNTQFFVSTFGSFNSDQAFDRVFVGNGPHYPFVEHGGWGWLEKLSRLSSDLLVTEGPVGMECRDMDACVPGHLRSEFNSERFLKAMHLHWDMLRFAPSPSYTPDRYVFAWKRKDDLIECSMERYADYLRVVYGAMRRWIKPTDCVVEVCCRHDRGVITPTVIPCKQFVGVDRDASRVPAGGVVADVTKGQLPECDVVISTAILHHTPYSELGIAFKNMAKNTRKFMVFTGPNRERLKALIGDHRWHIDLDELNQAAMGSGFRVIHSEGIGLNEPYCELLVAMERE